MRIFTILLCVAVMAVSQLSAEGTRQVAPNGSIVINASTTTDIAALHINNPEYHSFAAYDNPDPQSRLYIHIVDPSTECLYLGFNWAHDNITSMNPPRINFQYRIKDPNGNVVFGPVTVTPAAANIQNWAEGFAGPMQINGAGGYDASNVTSASLISQGWTGAGDYYIEFRDDAGDGMLIDFWDITVADCSTATPVERPGRVWSYNWAIFAINDFGFPLRPFNGAFYVCAPDPDNINASFVTKIDFNGSGFRPAAFNVAFNSSGTQNTGNVSDDRKSAQGINLTRAEYAIFLNDPIDICETATVGEISIEGISRCLGEDYCIKFTTTKAGQIDLLLDFDGPDNVYTPGTADIMLTHIVTPDQVNMPTCIDWDGKDGLGNPLPPLATTQVPITIAYAQGIYHFPIYDAEFMTNGFMIESVRPVADVPLLYYDDSNISTPSGSGEPPVQLSGCSTPCHRWTNYTQPDFVGFGNLNTINSWWFSQLIIRQDVFFLPGYYICEVSGPDHFCTGQTSTLEVATKLIPLDAAELEIIGYQWSGPGIVGNSTGSQIQLDQPGEYSVEFSWLTHLGDTCSRSCSYSVTQDPVLTGSIDTLILSGEQITINGETYSEPGDYTQLLSNAEGCDSLLTIHIIVLNTVIHYDLNACESFMSNGSHMDYSEFVPAYPQPLSCADIEASTLYRNNPQMMKHSCTPGVDDSPGMCVTTLSGCTYVPGHEISVIIEVTITPDPDTAVHLTGFSFFEKAPTSYQWISGNSGPNNYPTWFRVRVLKNGVEIYLSPATPTSPAWKEEVYDFLDNDEFIVTDPATFRFELLSYCPVGNGAVESVWDLDEIDIVASCVSPAELNKDISGMVTTEHGVMLPDVEVYLTTYPGLSGQQTTTTGEDGIYLFENLLPNEGYSLRGYKNTDFLNGVSTLDLIRIQKHLLGISPFTSPYQMIAADANKSSSVSAIDLLELRKLILGIYTELPHNTSWRFGIAGQDLTIGYPWLFNEIHTVTNLERDISDLNFIGVKIGDVNGDVEPHILSAGFNSRSNEKIILRITEQPLVAGVPVRVDFSSSEFNDIAGMQFTLKVEDANISGITGGTIELGNENFVITADGEIRLSWHPDQPVSFQSDEVLFTLIITPDHDGSLKDVLSIGQEALRAEAYSSVSLDKLGIELEVGWPALEGIENYLFQNEPNPFSQSTIVRFQLKKQGYATYRIFDLSGRLCYEKSGLFNQGMNSLEISKTDLVVGHGLIIGQLKTDGFVAVQKIVVNGEQ